MIFLGRPLHHSFTKLICSRLYSSILCPLGMNILIRPLCLSIISFSQEVYGMGIADQCFHKVLQAGQLAEFRPVVSGYGVKGLTHVLSVQAHLLYDSLFNSKMLSFFMHCCGRM